MSLTQPVRPRCVVHTELYLVLVLALTLMQASAGAAPERFQCSIETEAAAAVIDLRDRGQTRAFVSAPLPPRESVFNSKRGTLQARLAVQMYSIIDDVYAHPDLAAAPYLAYRMAACSQRNAGRKVPITVAAVSLPMAGCQEKHGKLPSSALSQCAVDVIAYYQATHRSHNSDQAAEHAPTRPQRDTREATP